MRLITKVTKSQSTHLTVTDNSHIPAVPVIREMAISGEEKVGGHQHTNMHVNGQGLRSSCHVIY